MAAPGNVTGPAREARAEPAGPAFRREHPGPHLPGRRMPNVLRVATLQVGHPMPFLVLVKAHDSSLGRHSRSRPSFAKSRWRFPFGLRTGTPCRSNARKPMPLIAAHRGRVVRRPQRLVRHSDGPTPPTAAAAGRLATWIATWRGPPPPRSRATAPGGPTSRPERACSPGRAWRRNTVPELLARPGGSADR